MKRVEVVPEKLTIKCAKACNLGKFFDLGRTEISQRIQQMEADKRFKGSVISLGPKTKLIDIEKFHAFLKTQDKAWIKS